ncbi:iron transporter [Natronobeatus ordinarius]|uniref:iron transporter n=1 Tax=Natronobeatus ordinarius TaxID=2963433 RepID=UPI0020CD5921|nr:iron transporter [Natronobeatus ordinarius]
MTGPRQPRYTRRRLLEGATIAGGLAVAGCTSNGGDDGADADDGIGNDLENDLLAFPEIEDPPEAVYRPTHREQMVMLEPVVAGEYVVAPMYTYPHPFWIFTGDLEHHEPTPEEDVHLMVTVWDRETGVVVPIDASVTLELFSDDDLVSTTTGWLMISQQMGFHFGDNVPLDGDGTYRVEGRIAPLDVRRIGAFEGRFEEAVDFAFEFDFDRDDLHTLVEGIEYFPEEEWGEPGALEPMGHGDHVHGDHDDHHDHHHDHHDHHHDHHDHHHDHHDHHHDDDHRHHDEHNHNDHHDDDHRHHDEHDVSYSALPPAQALPGTLQGTPESGDAVLATTLIAPGSRFVDGDEWYLAISPRTPYNRCVLPLMALEATLEGADGTETVDLVETLDHELEYHYGAPLSSASDGDELTIAVRTPPQVSRHQGYETAFVEMPDVTLELSP